jgi:hypothetical protein
VGAERRQVSDLGHGVADPPGLRPDVGHQPGRFRFQSPKGISRIPSFGRTIFDISVGIVQHLFFDPTNDLELHDLP